MIGKLSESAAQDVSEASFPNVPISKFIPSQGDNSVILLGGQVSPTPILKEQDNLSLTHKSQHRRHAYRRARQEHEASITSTTTKIEEIQSALQKADALEKQGTSGSRKVPPEITAVGHGHLWLKSIVEWKAAIRETQSHLEAGSSSSQAFLLATESILVALYDLVCSAS